MPLEKIESELTALPAGPRALLIECGTSTAARACYRKVQEHWSSGSLDITDVTPGATTVLLDGVDNTAELADRIRNWELEAAPPQTGTDIEIPVIYDGPDLADVAQQWGVGEADVPRLHGEFTYQSSFCGFMPGFAYLDGTPEEKTVSRRASPRTHVPAGSVALAGQWSAIYPRETPGGWQLIGTMAGDQKLWDAHREPAALLAPGTTVRFINVEVNP